MNLFTYHGSIQGFMMTNKKFRIIIHTRAYDIQVSFLKPSQLFFLSPTKNYVANCKWLWTS